MSGMGRCETRNDSTGTRLRRFEATRRALLAGSLRQTYLLRALRFLLSPFPSKDSLHGTRGCATCSSPALAYVHLKPPTHPYSP